MSLNKEKIELSNWELVSVNPNSKNWNWTDIFCFWSVGTQSIISFALISSLYLLYDLNFYEVFFGTIIASLLICFLSSIVGSPSQKHGIPFPVFLRISSGYLGAKYISLLRGIVGIFFFGVQTYFISRSIGYLIRISLFNIDSNLLNNDIFLIFFMSMNLIDWIALLLTLFLQYFLFSKGQKLIRNIINFSALFVYFGLFLFFVIFLAESDYYVTDTLISQLNIVNGLENFRMKNTLGVTGTFFAYYSILILNFGDYSRYVKNYSELLKGNISLVLTSIIFSFFALFIVTGSDIYFKTNSIEINNLLTNPTDIIGKINNTYLTVSVLIFILIASLSSNLIANYIPSQNVILNFLPKKMTLKTSGLFIIFLGLFVAFLWTPFFSQNGSLSIIDTLACFFGPIFGVMTIDYYYIKKKEIINSDIFFARQESVYMYSKGWNYKSVYSILIGTVFAFTTIWNFSFNNYESFSWIIGLIVSSIIYYLLASEQ